MSHEQELLARGAETVTGELILNRKTVGRYRNGQFFVTEDGLAELEVLEVAAKVVPPAPKPKKEKKTSLPPAAPAEDGDDLTSILAD